MGKSLTPPISLVLALDPTHNPEKYRYFGDFPRAGHDVAVHSGRYFQDGNHFDVIKLARMDSLGFRVIIFNKLGHPYHFKS